MITEKNWLGSLQQRMLGVCEGGFVGKERDRSVLLLKPWTLCLWCFWLWSLNLVEGFISSRFDSGGGFNYFSLSVTKRSNIKHITVVSGK